MNINRLVTRNLDSQFNELKKLGVSQQRDLVYSGNQVIAVKAPRSAVIRGNGAFRKSAVVTGTGADVTSFDPLIRNPLLNVTNFYLPERREILNQWLRYYDRFDPIVGNCMDLHAVVPFSRFSFVGIDDPAVRTVFEDMADDMRLFRKILDISREFELIGEVFPFAHWSDNLGYFDDMMVLNPDYINVRGIQQAGKDTEVLELIPDPELRALIHSDNVTDMIVAAELNPELVNAVLNNMTIQLDKFNTEGIMRKQSPYDQRGTSTILRCMKNLLYKDKLLEAEFSIAEGKITPYQIWKLGSAQGNYMPTDEDLDDFRKLLQSGKGDFDYNIITHYALDVQFIGLEGKLLNIIKELEYVDKSIMIALFTPQSFITGEGTSFATAGVGLRVYQARYDVKRDIIIDYIKRKLFEPVSMANEFYKRRPVDLQHNVRTQNDRKKLIVPDFKWEGKVNLVDDPEKARIYNMLRQQKEVPLGPLLEMIGQDSERIQNILKSEQKGEFSFNKVTQRMQGGSPMGGFGGGMPQLPSTPEGQINSEQRKETQGFKAEQRSAIKKK